MSAGSRAVPALQGAFYVATGLWPIVHLRSFEAVTGPKRERWLVKTTGALIAAGGVALLVGAGEPRSRATVALGVGAALALATADVIYVAKRRISPVYLADAAMELAVVIAWLASGGARSRSPEARAPLLLDAGA